MIHHLLPKFDRDSEESCLSQGIKLDNQANEDMEQIKHTRQIATSLQEGHKELANLLNSEASKEQFRLTFLQQSRLVLMLNDIASQVAIKDGWLLISTAGNLIKLYAPEELDEVKMNHGHTSLMKLIEASELFYVKEEKTDKGGSRHLFRYRNSNQI